MRGRRRGSGCIYLRGATYWIKYYRNGKPVQESSGSRLEKDARTLLSRRLGAIATGQPIAPRAEKVTLDEILEDLIREYEVNGRQSLWRAKISVAHLKEFFTNDRAQALDTAKVRDYIARRQPRKAEDGTEIPGATNATINRELAALKRAYTLACQASKILTKPYIPMLREDNIRQGFFEREQVEAVRRHLPDALKPVLSFAAITGWRLSEVLRLTWAQVDLSAGTVRLEPGTTKNRLGRMFPFTPELRALLEHQRAHTERLNRQMDRIIPHVFHRRGKPIKDFRGAWEAACESAGISGRLFHDLRRTAVRNLERAGVSRSAAMKLTGHKTETVYRRYAIVSEADLRLAVDQLHHLRMGTNTVTTGMVSDLKPREGAG